MNFLLSSIGDEEAKDISVVFMKIYGAEDVNNHMHQAGRLAKYVLVCTYSPKKIWLEQGTGGARDGRCSSVIDADYSRITVIFYGVLWPTYSSLYLVKH